MFCEVFSVFGDFSMNIVARIVWRLYKTGWIDNWIYWITHNYSVYAL
jgi:hypothetical protein